MKLRDFLRDHEFSEGTYEIRTTRRDGSERSVLSFGIRGTDVDGARHLPDLALPDGLKTQDLRLILAAAVRAGASHPGLRDEDLVKLHRAVAADRHIELFTDLNALTTGLLQHLALSLGAGIGRIVMSSSSIDVLHEHPSKATGSEAHLQRNEMARALRVLDQVRDHAPVHVHQLPPGSARYFQRGSAAPTKQPRPADPTAQTDDAEAPEDEHLTYISEDRQMIGAYWHYVTTTNPRLPVYLVTSDFTLAHVCAAERVPFLFARSPHDAHRSDAAVPKSLWFDPFALALRYCLPHELLWELCLVYRDIQVIKRDSSGEGFCLAYDPKGHLPASPEDITKRPLPTLALPDSQREPGGRGREKPLAGRLSAEDERRIRLSLTTIVEVLPTRGGQKIPLSSFKSQNEDALRQLRTVGEQTELFTLGADNVVAGKALMNLLDCLKAGDYVGVNAIFRRVPAYERMLQEVADGARFPTSKAEGAISGWAVTLGAAYKAPDSLRYGLSEPSQETFARSIVRFHAEVGGGQAAVPLPTILDRVCTELALSPIRFETMLTRSLGRGTLRQYEAQRATVEVAIPAHKVLVSPSSAEPSSYFRNMEPGRGILLDGKLVSSLVKRPEDS